jgi:hypothetical protein
MLQGTDDEIYSFFMMRQNSNVVLSSASNKLNVKKNIVKTKLTYSQKKKTSVELTRLYIKGQDTSIAIYDGSKKKDDLSDCFLQAVHFLETHHSTAFQSI